MRQGCKVGTDGVSSKALGYYVEKCRPWSGNTTSAFQKDYPKNYKISECVCKLEKRMKVQEKRIDGGTCMCHQNVHSTRAGSCSMLHSQHQEVCN